MKNQKEILRFAPSPTGMPHIGNLRTAIVNCMYIKSRSNSAQMRLRIEDTDPDRSKPEFTKAILQSMNWLGIHWQGDVVIQSERLSRHIEIANMLLNQNKAYRCNCVQNSNDVCVCKNREIFDSNTAIKLIVPKSGEIILEDKVKGKIVQKNENLQDIVIVRSNGMPTYMFCVVVDDHDMDITLVIRGEDHITNTFKQIHIYQALDWQIPDFAHLPMLLAPDGAKLSKRNAVTNILNYIDDGILSDALKNYLIMLSWRYERVQKEHNLPISDIFDLNQMAQYFDLKDLKSAPSKFDWQKLLDMNFKYINMMQNDDLLVKLEEFSGRKIENRQLAIQLLPEMKKRANTLKVLLHMLDSYLSAEYFENLINNLDEESAAIIAKSKGNLREYVEMLSQIDWVMKKIDIMTREFAEMKSMKLSEIAQALRIAISGSRVSIGIFEAMVLLGKEETLSRILYSCDKCM
ncbi:glutamate--tRNA ligase [Candidatus Gromoviella agglomerans]|uniref:glutamate--tRNA ligase n=1 Tax=Candidatus Gromoviella agglomerans TaxID=2806609 RepID=UPI001E6362FD|nr:glutamate--tRNA ligase [Candidatus Gromoviella agglomerans]UFX98501.1 Glutamate--tRNA ligase [Candidatus Gromoviella agglomerans]